METQNHNRQMNDVLASEFLNLRPQTLRNWRFKRKGPAYSKIGRRVVYQLTDLEAFLQENRIEPDSVSESC